MFNKYEKIFSDNCKFCSRKDFWIFTIFCVIIILLIVFLNNLLIEEHIFDEDILLVFAYAIGLLNIALQIKRLRDANLSPYILLLYSLIVLPKGVGNMSLIIILICLCLPTQRRNEDKIQE